MRFDFAELSPAEGYQLLGGLVVPRPIALVTTQDAGRPRQRRAVQLLQRARRGAAARGAGIAVSASGGAKDTASNIRDNGEFVVHLVDEAIAEAMNFCAIDLPPERSEIEIAGFSLLPSERVAGALRASLTGAALGAWGSA